MYTIIIGAQFNQPQQQKKEKIKRKNKVIYKLECA
jgi:hypothetical protein